MNYTTSCSKPIWIVTFKDSVSSEQTRIQKIVAYDLKELLSFFNEGGHNKIVRIEKTDDEITYHY